MNLYIVVKFFHLLSLASFLGSIFTFIFISAMIDNADVESASGRIIIAEGTKWITMPSLWILACTGLLSGWKRYGTGSGFFKIKLLLAVLMLANAYIFILPAVNEATKIAVESGEILSDTYRTAYRKESLFGALNVIFAFAAMIAGLRSVSLRQE